MNAMWDVTFYLEQAAIYAEILNVFLIMTHGNQRGSYIHIRVHVFQFSIYIYIPFLKHSLFLQQLSSISNEHVCTNTLNEGICKLLFFVYGIELRLTNVFVWHCSIEQQMSKQGPINPDIQRQTIEALLTEPGAAVEKCLKPEFLHLAPPLHSARDEVSHK